MKKKDIINNINKEMLCINANIIPLDVFPCEIQEIILDLYKFENFNIEYTIGSVLSATAVAIGNSYAIRIRPEWYSSPSLYLILIGRPGMGKTPPIDFAFRPIRDNDELELKSYKLKLKDHVAKEIKDKEMPKYKRSVISDFTPEALITTHFNNPRGIALVIDEILGMFNSVNRYNNKNNLIETLLSAYSGQPIDSIRKSEALPIYVKRPCINIIGNIQTKLVKRIVDSTYSENGLIDRFLFIYPQNKKINKMNKEYQNTNHQASKKWDKIITRLLELECTIDEDGNCLPHIINMSDDALTIYIDWYNSLVDFINEVEDDNLIESRIIKRDNKVARLALIIQLLRWACGEASKDEVDQTSVEGSIRLINYFEEGYDRILETIYSDNDDPCYILLKNLPETFTASEAIIIAKDLNISERATYNYLDNLCSKHRLKKQGQRRSAIYYKTNK